MSQFTPGIDVSRWQGAINWQTVAASGYKFAVIRATVSHHYTDPRFYINWEGAKNAGLLVSAYHVIKPDHPAAAQIERLFNVLDNRRADFPLVLDVELDRGKTKAEITESVRQCLQLMKERDGRPPIVYTGKWFWDDFVSSSSKWAGYDLWAAHYEVAQPTLPRGWSEWKFWQYSETGRVAGVGSQNTDLNWFNGSYEALQAYAGQPDTSSETGDVLAAGTRVRVSAPTLKIRSGPGVNYDHIGDLPEGTLLSVRSIRGKDVWVEFEPGQWAAFSYQGFVYMTLD